MCRENICSLFDVFRYIIDIQLHLRTYEVRLTLIFSMPILKLNKQCYIMHQK